MVRLTTLAAVCVLAVEIVAVSAAGQQIGLMIVNRPDQAVDRAAQWADAVLTHRPGAGDAAISGVAGWSSDKVLNLLVEVASIRLILKDPDTRFFPLPIDFEGKGGPKEIRYTRAEHATLLKTAAQIKGRRLSDLEFIARAIVLHSDIAILGNGTGNMLRTVDGTRMEADFRQADHWSMSRRLAQLLDKKAGRDADLALWYQATITWMAAVEIWNTAHVDASIARFESDAALQFLAGCLHEKLAAPATQAAIASSRLPPGVTLNVDSPADELKEATMRLRRAVALDPQLVDARIRLGRALTLTGRSSAAIEELRAAVPLAREPEQKYYAQIFLGAAFENVNNPVSAQTAYRAAAVLFPQAQVPRLALSQLAALSGDRKESLSTLEPLLSAKDGEPQPDPWWSYYPSCGRRAPELLDQARRRLTTTRAQ